ncbi:hypothetical protein GQ600_16700 [Phytophthora cactorum]|nr:hypothetical protein GQ600_16700 [Phytophthora cactorum]
MEARSGLERISFSRPWRGYATRVCIIVCSFPICSNGGHKGSSPAVVAMSYASKRSMVDCSKCKPDKLVLFLEVLN